MSYTMPILYFGVMLVLWVAIGLLIARVMPRSDYGVDETPEYTPDQRIMLTCRSCGCEFPAKISSSDECFECYIKRV